MSSAGALRRLFVLVGLALLAAAAFARPAAAAEEPTMPTDTGCVYVAEDWNGYEFTYYCPKGSKHELGPFFNVHNKYYVNWDRSSDNSTWDEFGPYTGQPCTRDPDAYDGVIKDTTRSGCLDRHDWTGLGEWMRGQDGKGILDQMHELKDIKNDPCSVLPGAVRGKCPDPRKGNPCAKIADKDQKTSCNTSHPWFEWEPPLRPADPDKDGCKYSSQASADCAGTQLIGNGKVQAPRGVVAPLARGAGYLVVTVFVAGMFGLVLHLYFGVQAYRGGDTVAEVFGRISWTLLACVGATGASGLVWTVLAS